MMNEEGSTKILNFITLRVVFLVQGYDYISYILRMHYVFKNHFLHSQAQVRQTVGLVMMSNEEST